MRPLHVLVLDHDEARRDELLALLRSGGHQASAATNPDAVAERLATPGVELLVLDLDRPELDLPRLREILAPSQTAEPESLDASERRHIALTLHYTGGNKRRAAQLLGISRSTLLHKVRKYGLTD
jgi:DNA-binding NtrC family response regulator